MALKQAYSDARVAELMAEYRRTGEQRLRDEIVEHMRPLVQAVARKFSGREPGEDLESEGYVGLIRAVDRFEPEKGTRFSTFAMHLVAGQIRHYLRDRGHLIRQPAWVQELNTRVQRATARLEQQFERPPTTGEIAAATNLTEEAVEELQAARQAARLLRLEASADDDEDTFLDVDPEKIQSRDFTTFELPVEERIVVEAALEKLKELERNVIYYFFYQDFSQTEIARKLGISCNYAGYVLRNGLKHLRERMPQDRPLDRRGPASGDVSVLDEVSGVYTREYFDRRLSEEISRAQRFGHSVSVCCLQLPIDCTDDALREAAQTLRKRTRKADVVARTGPLELAAILPNTGAVAEQVALRLAEQLYPVVGDQIHAAAVTYPESGRTAQQLISAARDAAFPGSLVRISPALAGR